MRSIWTDHQFFFNLIAFLTALGLSLFVYPTPLAAVIALINLLFSIGRRIAYLRSMKKVNQADLGAYRE
jgi:hypothetical protein